MAKGKLQVIIRLSRGAVIANPIVLDIDGEKMAMEIATAVAEAARNNLPGKTPGGDHLPPTHDSHGTHERGKQTGRFARSWRAVATGGATAAAVATALPGQAERVYQGKPLFRQAGLGQEGVAAAIHRAANAIVQRKG